MESGESIGGSYAEVALFNALDKTLHYLVPPALQERVRPGVRVLVPVGKRKAMGLVVHLAAEPPALAGPVVFRPVLAAFDETPAIPPELLTLCSWLARYYLHPLGEVLQLAVPAGARKDRQTESGTSRRPSRQIARVHLIAPPPEKLRKSQHLSALLALLDREGGSAPRSLLQQHLKNVGYWLRRLEDLECLEVETAEDPCPEGCPPPSPVAASFDLSADQEQVLNTIRPHLIKPAFKAFVLHGVTGSGKSEIYLRLIESALQQDLGALILVPEIALTFQLEAIFRRRFGPHLAIWHSGLSPRAREAQWHDLLTGRRRVLLGARSAVLMPLAGLGLIVVDEEHDSSYKQDDHLRYQARDVALMRAQMMNIPVVLGSATPSLQSIYHARTGRYTLLSLPRRIHDRPLPDLEIIDMRRESRRQRILSRSLQEALASTVKDGQQALLFLNRRGFATFALCNVCGEVLLCENCSVSFTYHEKKGLLCCHYCGLEKKLPERCPVCDHPALILHGFGTERIEKEVKKLLPEARVLRIDRDTVAGPRTIAERLEAVRQQQVDILIGTQMLTKGHDFPNLTLVGIVNADTALQIADFRAGETTVQLLMQVAGRAGRGEKPGRVLLQTYNPSHYTIQSVVRMDYLGFCEEELASREQLQYPPYARMLRLLVTSPEEPLTAQAAHALAALCREVAGELRLQEQHLAILGPSPAPLSKLKNRFRWHLLVKAWTSQTLQQFTESVKERSRHSPLLRRVQLAIDRDPIMVL